MASYLDMPSAKTPREAPKRPRRRTRRSAPHRPPTHVQSLLFRRDEGWTASKAKAWAKSHGYHFGKVDVTAQYIRIRQEDPRKFRIKRTVDFGHGIRAVVGREESVIAAETPRRRRKKTQETKMARRRRKRTHHAAPKRRRRHVRAAEAPRRRRRRRRTHAYAPVAAAPRRHRRRRHHRRAYAPVAAAPRRRRRHRRHAYAPVAQARRYHRRRHHYARSNPMRGGELALAFISGGLGYALADFVDRYLATYDPAATTAPPTNKFTGGSGTMANTLNIASPPGLMRIGVGLGVTVLPGLGAWAARGAMAKAALNGAMIGAGIKLFSSLFNSYVMGNLLKTNALGERLYPAEITAAQNISASAMTTGGTGFTALADQSRDVGPFALAAAPAVAFTPASAERHPEHDMSAMPPTPPRPHTSPVNVPGHMSGLSGNCPSCDKPCDDCGCSGLGKKQNGATTNYAYLGVVNEH